MSNIALKNTLVPLKDPNNPEQNYQFIDSFPNGNSALIGSKLQTALTACDTNNNCGGVTISEYRLTPSANSEINYVYTLIETPTINSPSSSPCKLQFYPNNQILPLIGADEPRDRYSLIINPSRCTLPSIPMPKKTTTDAIIDDKLLLYVGIGIFALILIMFLKNILFGKSKGKTNILVKYKK